MYLQLSSFPSSSVLLLLPKQSTLLSNSYRSYLYPKYQSMRKEENKVKSRYESVNKTRDPYKPSKE